MNLSIQVGEHAKTILAWPNADVSTIVGKKRLAALPENVRLIAVRFYYAAQEAHERRREKHRDDCYGQRPRAIAVDGTVRLAERLWSYEDALRVYKRAKREALRQRLEAEGVPFDLKNRRCLQGLAKKNGIVLSVDGNWGKYGFFVTARVVPDKDAEKWAEAYKAYLVSGKKNADEKRRAACRARAEKKEEERQDLARRLGVRADSRTFAAYQNGDIDEETARGIGAYTRRRHENTNYDELLRAGYSQDDARAMMEVVE